MNVISFKESLKENNLPRGLSICLKALWYEGKGDWDTAHKLIQDLENRDAAWIHAYLHRKEGDLGNADYWYHRAGKRRQEISLEKEWEEIAATLLKREDQ